MSKSNKNFYLTYHDTIRSKRVESPFPLRRMVHNDIYESIIRYIKPNKYVLDAGCGEGDLSIRIAKCGANVTGIDYSLPNVEAAKSHANQAGVNVLFSHGDAERIPFDDGSFDVVVSNHVLEHLPSFETGLKEIFRVTNSEAIIAVPTCLNLCAISLLGRDNYWKVSWKSPFSMVLGFSRVIVGLVLCRDGVNEGYAGSNIHVFRFPWVVKRLIESAGFSILEVSAQSIRLPYFQSGIKFKLFKKIDKYLGIGTVFYCKKI